MGPPSEGTSEGTSDAIESVLARFGDMVRRVGRARGLREHDVSELLQEVRVRLWRARGTDENIRSVPASYVYRAAHTAAVDLIRRRRARPTEPLDASHGHGAHLVTTDAGPEAELLQAELAERVAQAVGELIDSRRPVVRMYLAGYRLEEISGLLGWSSAKTRNLLYRGLADLRSRLADMGLGPEGVA